MIAFLRVRSFLWVVAAMTLVSCNSLPYKVADHQPDFQFQRDTFGFVNEVIELNPGKKDLYALHCFVMTCSANRFWKFARFEPDQPKLSDAEYARLIYKIAHQPFYKPPYAPDQRIVVPGFANVHEFSTAYVGAFRKNIGSKYISCLSYRNWRMSWGTTSEHQMRTARQIMAQLDGGLCDQVHIVDWPAMDHTALLYAYKDFPDRVEFTSYDPNDDEHPLLITYDKARRYFTMPKVAYYRGGRITLHRMYYSWWR